ncbi:hypothetical protein [Paraburkholderia caledonica]
MDLVKRVEIHKDEIVVVFRIDPQPRAFASENLNDSDDGVKSMQHCTRRKNSALRNTFTRGTEQTVINASRLDELPEQGKEALVGDALADPLQ